MNNSDAFDIRTDEQMPSREELSEQESSDDMDAPWAGVNCCIINGHVRFSHASLYVLILIFRCIEILPLFQTLWDQHHTIS